VFSEQDSIMLALHGSNLQQYLDNLASWCYTVLYVWMVYNSTRTSSRTYTWFT
jgi:hypothetical protein